MNAVVPAVRALGHLLIPICAPLLLVCACTNPVADFTAHRAADRCDSQWPVCDQIAGCVIGDQSYVEGHFPGITRVVVQLFEPSTVRARFLVETLSAAGGETVLTWFEEGCRARVRQTVSGRTFVGEAEQRGGLVEREAELTGVGDHLIEIESDARATFLLAVDVVPTRQQR